MKQAKKEEIEVSLHIALSLARGNSPAITSAERLDKIAGAINKALALLQNGRRRASP